MKIDVDLIPGNLQVQKTGDNTPAQSLFRFLLRISGWHQVALCLVAILVSLINLVPIELQRRIVDGAIEGRDFELLIWLGGFYAVVLLLHQLTKFIFRLYQGWVSESTSRNIRQHLLELRQAHRDEDEKVGSGSTVSVLTTEVESLSSYVGEHISNAASNLMMLISVSAYMLYVEPQIAVFALLVFFPQVLLTPLMQKWLNRLVKKRVELVRTFGESVTHNRNEATDILKPIYLNRMRFFIIKYAMKALINLLNATGPLVVLIYGGYLAINGNTSAGVIVAFLSGFERMAGPFRGMINFYRQTAQASVQHFMIARWMLKTMGKAER